MHSQLSADGAYLSRVMRERSQPRWEEEQLGAK
jgi:hypothetical protein